MVYRRASSHRDRKASFYGDIIPDRNGCTSIAVARYHRTEREGAYNPSREFECGNATNFLNNPLPFPDRSRRKFSRTSVFETFSRTIPIFIHRSIDNSVASRFPRWLTRGLVRSLSNRRSFREARRISSAKSIARKATKVRTYTMPSVINAKTSFHSRLSGSVFSRRVRLKEDFILQRVHSTGEM